MSSNDTEDELSSTTPGLVRLRLRTFIKNFGTDAFGAIDRNLDGDYPLYHPNTEYLDSLRIYRCLLPGDMLLNFDRFAESFGLAMAEQGYKLRNLSVAQARDTLKACSAAVKAKCDVSPGWNYFADVETFFGYIVSQPLPEEEIDLWFFQPVPKSRDDYFYARFQKGVDIWLNNCNWASSVSRFKRDKLTYKKWFNRDTWATDGSVFNKARYLPNIPSGVSATKSTLAAIGERELLYEDSLSIENAVRVFKLIKKSEMKKVRGVVKVADVPYLLEKCVMDIFEPAAKNHPYTTLFSDNANYVSKFMDILSGEHLVNMPLDQGSFDHHVDQLMQWIVVHSLSVRLRRSLDIMEGSEWDYIFSAFERLYSKPAYIVGLDGVKRRIENGLASGTGLTALIGTVVSFALWFVCSGDLFVDTALNFTQGDDLCVGLREGNKVSQLIDDAIGLYRLYGFNINKNKFWISPASPDARVRWNEFLRVEFRIGEGSYARLLPTRALASLRFANPLNSHLSGWERLNQQCTGWQSAVARGLNVSPNVVAGDIAADSNQPVEKCLSFVCLLSVLGGCGMAEHRTLAGGYARAQGFKPILARSKVAPNRLVVNQVRGRLGVDISESSVLGKFQDLGTMRIVGWSWVSTKVAEPRDLRFNHLIRSLYRTKSAHHEYWIDSVSPFVKSVILFGFRSNQLGLDDLGRYILSERHSILQLRKSTLLALLGEGGAGEPTIRDWRLGPRVNSLINDVVFPALTEFTQASNSVERTGTSLDKFVPVLAACEIWLNMQMEIHVRANVNLVTLGF